MVLIVQNAIVLNQKCAMAVMNTKVLFFTAIKKNVPFIIVVLKKNGFKNCSECREIPCEIWKKTLNPKFSDEEFAKNIKERIEILKSL